MFEASRRDRVLANGDVRVEVVDRPLGAVDLRRADRGGRVDDLALQVGDVDHIVVDEADRAHAGRGEVERGRRAQATGAQQQHLGVEQLLLALGADLGEQEVARVALALLGRERARDLDGVAAVLPERVAAGHRLDALVAELLLKRLGGKRRAVARGAVEDHALGAIGGSTLDPGLQVTAGDELRARDVPGVPLVALAHVDDHDAVGAEDLADRGGVDLVDLGLDLLDVLGAGGAHLAVFT